MADTVGEDETGGVPMDELGEFDGEDEIAKRRLKAGSDEGWIESSIELVKRACEEDDGYESVDAVVEKMFRWWLLLMPTRKRERTVLIAILEFEGGGEVDVDGWGLVEEGELDILLCDRGESGVGGWLSWCKSMSESSVIHMRQ